MSTLLNFDFSNIDPDFGGGGGFLPISDDKGWLVVLTGDNGWKPAPKGGSYLELVGKGQEGPVAGQDFALRLNLQHVNVTAQQIAAAQLSAIGHVLGFPGRIPSTGDLFNKPFRLVSVKQNNTEYTQLANNGIRDVNGNAPTGGKGPQVAQPAQQVVIPPSNPPQQQQQFQQQPNQQFQPNPQQVQQPQQQQGGNGGWVTGPALSGQGQGQGQGQQFQPQQQQQAFQPQQGQGGPQQAFQPQQQQQQAFQPNQQGQGGNMPSWAQSPGQ